MNERIQELESLCWKELSEEGAYYLVFETEKFADLIVRECAGIYSKIDNGNSHLGTDDYLTALVKHFRVK